MDVRWLDGKKGDRSGHSQWTGSSSASCLARHERDSLLINTLKKSTIRIVASAPAVLMGCALVSQTDSSGSRPYSLGVSGGRPGPRGDGARLSLPTLGCLLTSLPQASLSSGDGHEAKVAPPTSPAGQPGGADSQRERVTATNLRTGSKATDTQTTCPGQAPQPRTHKPHARGQARAGSTATDTQTTRPGQAPWPRTHKPHAHGQARAGSTATDTNHMPRAGSMAMDTQTTCPRTSQGRLHIHRPTNHMPVDKPGRAPRPWTSTPRPQMSRRVKRLLSHLGG